MVKAGSRFSVSLEERSLRVGKSYLIKDGRYEGSLGVEPADLQTALERIEELYRIYRHSIPSERSDGKRRSYFVALKEHELDNDDMLYGVPREVAQVSLELYVLCSILNGSLAWDEERLGKWFWQSAKYPDLVIFKKWICK